MLCFYEQQMNKLNMYSKCDSKISQQKRLNILNSLLIYLFISRSLSESNIGSMDVTMNTSKLNQHTLIMAPSRDSMAFTSTKGLLNGPGQNNCFLNSAVQVSLLLLSNYSNFLTTHIFNNLMLAAKLYISHIFLQHTIFLAYFN